MQIVALKKANRKAEPATRKSAVKRTSAVKTEAKAESKPQTQAQKDKPAGKGAAPPSKKQSKFLALARVQGRLVSEGQRLFIQTPDGARLSVTGFGPKQGTLIRMFTSDVKDRDAVYSLWPAFEGSYTISAYHDDPASFEPAEGTPDLDQMFIRAKIVEMAEDSFCVEIGRNQKPRKGQSFKSNFRVSSPPPEEWEVGQRVDFECDRAADKWRLISKG